MIHVREQNAGLLLTGREDSVLFEGFELLATNHQVVSCKGRLIREFPDCAAVVPHKVVRDAEFLGPFTRTIGELEVKSASMTRRKSKKQGTEQDEERDTVSPFLVTNMLMGALSGLGSCEAARPIWKKSREQVSWLDAELPFHRSSTWLLLRVALRLVLDRQSLVHGCPSWYKPVMAFHHSMLLKVATQAKTNTSILHNMVSKLAQRVVKLDPQEMSPWITVVQKSMSESHDYISRTWQDVQDTEKKKTDLTSEINQLQSLSFDKDSNLTLRALEDRLHWINHRLLGSADGKGPGDTTEISQFSPTEPPRIESRSGNGGMGIFGLLQCESWIEAGLQDWVSEQLRLAKANTVLTVSILKELYKLFDDYYSRANSLYKGNPEALSLMGLCVMELWVAMDRIAGQNTPLLLEYNPGFVTGMFNRLILLTKKQMTRLRDVEDYLAARRGNCRDRISYLSAWDSFGKQLSFANRYFSTSSRHQDILAEILENAQRDKANKIAEFNRLRLEYNELNDFVRTNSHQQTRIWNKRRTHMYYTCVRGCQVCSSQSRRDGLNINVYEWPLPADLNQARAVVFELNVPEVVLYWRRFTRKLLVEVFRDKAPLVSGERAYYATDYHGLSSFKDAASDLQPASTAKPFTTSHYSNKKIANTSESDVNKPHGSNYSYYDSKLNTSSTDITEGIQIPDSWSHAAAVPVKILQQWVRWTHHDSNQVIAAQSSCPDDMTLEEFRAFGHLRSGLRLQWANILCQLLIPSIDINKPAALFLVMQASTEAGRCGDSASVVRDAHKDLNDHKFAASFTSALGEAFSRICENWQNDTAVCLLVCLATRVLSLSPSALISASILDFLSKARATTIGWARELARNLGNSTSAEDAKKWVRLALMSSLVCMTTFDIGHEHLRTVLMSSDTLALFVEASILARDHMPTFGNSDLLTDPIRLFLSQRWHRVMHQAEGVVRDQIVGHYNRGISTAIKQFWAEYTPAHSSPWKARFGQQAHIVESTMSGKDVTFNLLTGTLLVNGFPLSKLPDNFRTDPAFVRLFSDQVLEVVPSTHTGMQFCACRKQKGWIVHFALVDQKLIIRAVCPATNETWEHIPPETFSGDLPRSFITKYAHWFNLTTRVIEFRPLAESWEASQETWRLGKEDEKYILRKGSAVVIAPRSQTARIVSKVMSPIERNMDINTIFHEDGDVPTISIDLPRFDISFTLKKGDVSIRSKNYCGMWVDKSQCIDSMIGLQNKLVLTSDIFSNLASRSRIVLVPRGQISYQRTENHMTASVSYSQWEHVKHDAFNIDQQLGCITDTGALTSKLLLCQLHAITSHALPDPLTGRTGTEEALRILRSGAVRSFQRMDSESMSVLTALASLTPVRRFYPAHLQDMESCTWSDLLPPLSQDDNFAYLAQSILEHARDCEVLYSAPDSKPDVTLAKDIIKGDPVLIERAKIRNATFRTSEYGAEAFTTKHDRIYRKRFGTSATERHQYGKLLARSLGSNWQTLLASQSGGLKTTIMDLAGSEFMRNPEISLDFDMELTRPISETFAAKWCGLHISLAAEINKYKSIFFLSGLLYSKNASMNIIHALMGCASVPGLKSAAMQPPRDELFNLKINWTTLPGLVRAVVFDGEKPFQSCPEFHLPRQSDEDEDDYYERRWAVWDTQSKSLKESFCVALGAQFTRDQELTTPVDRVYFNHLNDRTIMSGCQELVRDAWVTDRFNKYLERVVQQLHSSPTINVQEALRDCRCGRCDGRNSQQESTPPESQQPARHFSADGLFSRPAPQTERCEPEGFASFCEKYEELGNSLTRFNHLLTSLSQISDLQPHQQSYIEELYRSSDSSSSIRTRVKQNRDDDFRGVLEEYVQQCQLKVERIHNAINQVLEGETVAAQICVEASIYPRLSPVFLLQRLTRSMWNTLPDDWKTCLVDYVLSITHLQRAQRLLAASRNSIRGADFSKELLNCGDHASVSWDPLKYPESLLVEVEQGIMIRPVQNRIAAQMRDPPDGKNCVMQLNMGEGKSSVIVPIVAAALADGNRLMRIVVAKPQSNQMAHTLISKLGGLLNRRVFYLPYSRSLRLTEEQIKTVQRMFVACRQEGGVLLVQPEHLLSFKLAGLEHIWMEQDDPSGTTGQSILKAHRDFESVSRDIVDESDENFSVKFELIYTMGAQRQVEMSPDRWVIIQELLDILKDIARDIDKDDHDIAQGLLFDEKLGTGRFPTIRILEESTGDQLIKKLGDYVCRKGLKGFPIQHQRKRMRRAVLDYILNRKPSPDAVAMVEGAGTGFFSEHGTKQALLLLRGLLSQGVLSFALGQKRFRVNYGLAPDRRPATRLAVPYRAKDMPAPRSEFSHPDVIIVLTCLSYYYRGLEDPELETCLELLSRSDQADQEYSRWAVAAPQLAPTFRHFSSVNLKDWGLCEKRIFPDLRFSKPAIDFYLSNVVFAKEMREFPHKLSASGWDLAKPKTHPLTGFSGTNDSKYVLPLSVSALDLPEQRHTNAAVLCCLLRDENKVLEIGGAQEHLSALTVDQLLKAVTSSAEPMRVILDVGAQIIELSNLQVAQRWLAMVPSNEADAVIFFNDHDELSVLTRNGMVDSFLTSPFAKRTEGCLVFLDQAHTRGTDLKLPDSYRAAVTLGPGITKDTLVQACMRMRKLGHGQSVTFCVSSEMQKRIRDFKALPSSAVIDVLDILAWSISVTWDDAVRSVPLWATQGLRHQYQEKIWEDTDRRKAFSSADVRRYLEDEAQSLEERYLPRVPGRKDEQSHQDVVAKLNEASLELDSRKDQVHLIKQKCLDFCLEDMDSAGNLQEEQERELAPEIEKERQIQRPRPRDPVGHSLHEDVKNFALTGSVSSNSSGYKSAFQALKKSTAFKYWELTSTGFPSDLLATADFMKTVKETASGFCSDTYQRPVQWILTAPARAGETTPHGMHMMVVSQWEANQLKLLLMTSARLANTGAVLHAYQPRPSLTLRSLEDLNAYTVPAVSENWTAPSELVMQLNLFAGQLYIKTYQDYVDLCGYLGLSCRENEGDEEIAADGFLGARSECRFQSSPVAFLKAAYNIRRDHVDIGKTHMGRILAGEILSEKDFEV